jgi:hypothetical protein
MAKALKPLLFAVCVLSVGALALGVMLFLQREQIKGRITNLERSHQDIASNLQYNDLNMARLQDLDSMDAQIRGLTQAARNTFDELTATSNTLVQTRTTLAGTEEDLETTRAELASSETKVAELEDTLISRNAQITRQTDQISELDAANEELTYQVDGLQNEMQNTLALLQDAEQQARYWRAEFDKEVRSRPSTTPSGSDPFEQSTVEFAGRVLLVSEDWNFVIIDGGKNSELTDNVVLLIHRGTEPVGKIRVRMVEDKIALADIVQKWEGRSPAAGDQVISTHGTSSS